MYFFSNFEFCILNFNRFVCLYARCTPYGISTCIVKSDIYCYICQFDLALSKETVKLKISVAK